jgi:hypothetical protein
MGMKARIYLWMVMLTVIAMLLLVGCGKGGGY